MAYDDEGNWTEDPEVEEQPAPEPYVPPEPEPEPVQTKQRVYYERPEEPAPPVAPETQTEPPPQQYAQATAVGTMTDAAPEPKRRVYYGDDDGTVPAGAPVKDRVSTRKLSDLVTGGEGEKERVYYEKPEGPWATFGRELARGAPPAIAGAATGALTGAALTSWGGPIAFGGALVGGIAGGITADVVTDKALKAVGYDDDIQRAANARENPWAARAGSFLSQAFGGSATAAKTGARVLGAGIAGGWEAGSQLYQGKPLNLPDIATQAAGGFTFAGSNRPWIKGAEAAGAKIGTRFTGTPEAPQPIIPGTPPADIAAPVPPEQGALPFPTQALPYQPRLGERPQEAQIGGGERQLSLPPPGEAGPLFEQQPAKPARPGVTAQPELALEPPPVVNREGQLGFSIDAPHPDSTRTGQSTGAGTNRPAMPAAAGTAREMPPPSTPKEPEAYPHSAVRAGMEQEAMGVTPQAAAGIHVLQPGQIDPTVQHAVAYPARERTTFEPPRPPEQGPPAPPSGEPIPRERSLVPRPAEGTQGVTETPVPTDHTRMYQGERQPPNTFTTDRKVAEQYGPVKVVDVHNRQGMPFFTPTNEAGSFTTRNNIYRTRARPIEEISTQPTGKGAQPEMPPAGGVPPAGPTPPPTGPTPGATKPPLPGVKTASPELELKLKQAGVPPAEKPAVPPLGGLSDVEIKQELVKRGFNPEAVEKMTPKAAHAMWQSGHSIKTEAPGTKTVTPPTPSLAKMKSDLIARGYSLETVKGMSQQLTKLVWESGKTVTIEPPGPKPQLKAKPTPKSQLAMHQEVVVHRSPTTGIEHKVGYSHRMTLKDALAQHGTAGDLIGELTAPVRRMMEKLIGNMPVYFMPNSSYAKQGRNNYAGLYHWQQDIISINNKYLGDKESMAQTVFHEGIHGITSHALGLNPEVRGAVRSIMTDVETKHKPYGATKYGFINEREFVAEAFSNPKFQQMLAAHELSPNVAKKLQAYFNATKPIKSAWDALVQAVRNVLKLPENKMTALEAVMRATERAIKENPATKKKYMAKEGVKTQDYGISDAAGPPPGNKEKVIARDRFGNEVGFVGDTVHAAAAYAKAAGYKQIFHQDGTPYVPPKTAAQTGAQTPANTAQIKAGPGAGAAAKVKAASATAAATAVAPPPGSTNPPPPLGGFPAHGAAAAARQQQQSGFRSAVSKLVDTYKRTFDPARISEGALKGQAPARESRAFFEGEKTRITRAGEEAEKMWSKVPEAERIKALDDYENGRPIDPKYKSYFDTRFGPEMKRAHKEEAQEGSRAGYIEDYVAHEWNRPKPGQPSISEHFKSMGPTWFQKARTIDFINEGIRAGYTLRNSNPEALLRSRLIAGADMRSKARLLNDWHDMGMAARSPNEAVKKSLQRMGWQELNGPDRAKWMIAPDVQTIWKNGIEAKGLWQAEHLGGDAFRGWMAFKAVWVPLKLAASAFHALHVAHINMNTNLARAVTQVSSGDTAGAFKSLGKMFEVRSQTGIMGREQWALGEHARTPEGKEAVRMMEEGGFVPMMNEELQSSAKKDFQKAIEDKSIFKTPVHGLRYAIQKIQAPLFEHWIPHLKTAAYLNDAAALLQRRPDLLADHVNRKVALTEIAKSIDNRFGEMFYGGLFWNRYVKDVSIGSFLSLGWNLGFAREFGGAAIEAVSRPAQKYIPGLEAHATRKVAQDATNKIAFATTYMATAAVFGGAMTWMLTGKAPEDINDYIFPRVGGTNPDGSPRRLSTMFYTREIPMLMKHVQEHGGGVGGFFAGAKDMIWNKMLFQPIVELYQNRSYFGKEIYDTNAPDWEKFVQAGKHVLGEQFNPMSVSGAKRAVDTGGDPSKEVPLAFLGFGPAPKYAEASAMQNRIGHLYREHVAPGARAYEDEADTKAKLQARNDILMARQKDDDNALSTAIDKAIEVGLKPAYIKSITRGEAGDQKMFKQLPKTDQIHLLNSGSKEEIERYLPFAKKETRQLWYEKHPPE